MPRVHASIRPVIADKVVVTHLPIFLVSSHGRNWRNLAGQQTPQPILGSVGPVMSVAGPLIPETSEERNHATYIFSMVGIIISVIVLVATLFIGLFNIQPFLP